MFSFSCFNKSLILHKLALEAAHRFIHGCRRALNLVKPYSSAHLGSYRLSLKDVSLKRALCFKWNLINGRKWAVGLVFWLIYFCGCLLGNLNRLHGVQENQDRKVPCGMRKSRPFVDGNLKKPFFGYFPLIVHKLYPPWFVAYASSYLPILSPCWPLVSFNSFHSDRFQQLIKMLA